MDKEVESENIQFLSVEKAETTLALLGGNAALGGGFGARSPGMMGWRSATSVESSGEIHLHKMSSLAN